MRAKQAGTVLEILYKKTLTQKFLEICGSVQPFQIVCV